MKTFACSLLLSTCLSLSAHAADPAWLHAGPHTVLDGRSDDLVTGGLGAMAMVTSQPRAYADPLHPTAAELRQHALFMRGSNGQGFGRLYGPNVDHVTGQVRADDGKIAGEEYLAYADHGAGGRDDAEAGRQNVAMLLQVPVGLGAERRCLVAVPVNGSSSLFRDVVDFGYWGLRHGCAVVYTDKGHGNGFHVLEADSVALIDGRQALAAQAGRDAHFRADLDDVARAKFLADFPHRVAFKAAFSKQNPEKDWGENVRDAIRFAFDLPGFDTRMVPLTLYHLRALDVMWDHLTGGLALPPSQVVHTTPRGGQPGAAPPLLLSNVPAIALEPAKSDRIVVDAGRVVIPN